MSAVPVRAVLFDVDGTLVDSNYLHTVCWSQAFDQHGWQISMAAIHRAIGMGSDKLVPHLIGGPVEAQDAVVAAHGVLWATWWTRVHPTAGARDLVRACAARNLTVALATSASGPELRAMRRILDVDDSIDHTTDSDAAASKPDPDLFAAALARAGCQPEDALCVGDSVWDAEAAGKLGIRFIGLLCGGTSQAELLDAGASDTFPDPAALLAALGRELEWYGYVGSPATE